MSEYRIDLGISLREGELQNIQNKIKGLAKEPIKIQLDTQTVDTQIAKIKKDLASVNSVKGGSNNLLRFDTSSLERSLNEVATTIKEIRASLGTIDNQSGMKSLLSSVNQISAALEKTTRQFEGLSASLNSLAGKDFSINLGINMGGSNPIARNAAYGSKARGETIPQLQQQVAALENYLKQYYKVADGFNAVGKLIQGTGVATGANHPLTLLPQMADGSNLSKQMTAIKQYIALITEAARLKGIDLSSVTSGFSKSANELVSDAQKVQSGAAEMESGLTRLKEIFGGSGLNTEKLSAQLDSIVTDLSEIKTAIQGLTAGISIEGLTQSFSNLSKILETLVSDITTLKNSLGGGLSSAGSSVSGVAEDAKQAESAFDKLKNKVSQIKDLKIKIAGLDAEKNKALIAELTAQLDKLQAGYNKLLNTTRQNLDAGQLEELEQDLIAADNAANQIKADMADTSAIQKQTQAYRDLLAMAKQMRNLELNITKLKGMGGHTQEIEVLEQQLRELKATYERLKSAMETPLSAQQWKVVDAELEKTKNLIAQTEAKYADAKAKFADGLKLKIVSGGAYEDDISRIDTAFKRLSNQSSGLRIKIDAVKQALADMQAAALKGDIEGLISANERYVTTLKQVESQLRINKREEQSVNQSKSLVLARQNLSLQMSNWLKDNSAAAKQFGGRIQELQMQLKTCDMQSLGHIKGEFQKIQKEAKLAGKATQTFGDRLKAQFTKYSTYFSVYTLFMYATRALKSMFEQVKSIDSALTELKKVTDETEASYNRFLTNAASNAKKLGTTIDGLVESTADFARLGYGFEDAQELAEVANIYAVVGDEVEGVEGATESLISTMAAFKEQQDDISNSDFAMEIIDKFNEIGKLIA